MSLGVKGYEVYVCKRDNVIIYIGEGKFGRHKHCTSGTSHVYDLNRLHFEGVTLEVEVVKVFGTKKEAESFEKSLIEKHQPIYNNKGKFGYTPVSVMGLEIGLKMTDLKKSLERDLRLIKLSQVKVIEVMATLEEFLNYIGRDNVLRGSYKLKGRDHYSKLGLLGMSRLIRHIAYVDRVPNWVGLFFKNIYVHTKVNLVEQLYTKTDVAVDYWQDFIVQNKLY